MAPAARLRSPSPSRCSCSSACLFFLAGIRGSWVRSRIVAHTGEGKGKNAKKNRKERRNEALSTIFVATEKALGHLKQWRSISKMLERADVQLRTVEFVWIALGAGVITALLAFLFGAGPIILVAVTVAVGMIPYGIVWLKMRKRLKAFEDQLPDLLDHDRRVAKGRPLLQAGPSGRRRRGSSPGEPGVQASADRGVPRAAAG